MKFLKVIKDSLIEDYRKSNNVNNSLLKKISEGDVTVIRDGLPEFNSTYMDYGSYIDKIITEDKEPDVYVYPHTELSGHSKLLVDELIKRNKLEIANEGRLVISDELKLWTGVKKDDLRLKKVTSNEIETIINREIARKNGKDVISESDLKLAKNILNVLHTHEYSKDIVSPPLKIESYRQLALSFRLNGVEMKVLLDFLQINHKEKTLRPIDLKTGSKANFIGQKGNYFQYKYWLQGSLYYLAIMNLKNRYKELRDYKILPFQFLYISRERPEVPLVYELDEEAVSMYVEGYKDNRGQQRKGILDYLEDYKFHKETGIYDVTREEYENKGVIKLTRPY